MNVYDLHIIKARVISLCLNVLSTHSSSLIQKLGFKNDGNIKERVVHIFKDRFSECMPSEFCKIRGYDSSKDASNST